MTGWSTGPTLAGFQAYLTNNVQIPTSALPTDSPYPGYAYNNAIELVNLAIQAASTLIYTEAVYALATSNLLNFCPDQPGQTYFADIRSKWDMNSFLAGTVGAANDQGTSDSLIVPDYFRLFTVADLQMLKDPYGRRYIGFAQKYGTNIWGLT